LGRDLSRWEKEVLSVFPEVRWESEANGECGVLENYQAMLRLHVKLIVQKSYLL
jgi:hypothetical protein